MKKTIEIPAEWPASFSGELIIEATEPRAVTLWLTRERNAFLGGPQQAMKTLPEAQAIELRDALLEIYPVETAPKQETSYKVEKAKGWGYEPEYRVIRTRTNVPTTERDQVATCHDETTAHSIAAALES